MIQDITKETFQETISVTGLVAVLFEKEKCEPCVEMRPLYQEAAELRPDIKFCSLMKPIGAEYMPIFGLTGYPEIILYKDGEEIDRYAGVSTAAHFEGWLREVEKTWQS